MSHDAAATALVSIALRSASDVVSARRHAQEIADGLGVDRDARTRFATAVCETAWHALQAGNAAAEFSVEPLMGEGPWLMARITAGASAMCPFAEASPSAESNISAAAARRIVAHFRAFRADDDVAVFEIAHPLAAPVGSVNGNAAAAATALPNQSTPDSAAALHGMNQELLASLIADDDAHEQVERLNSELEATNRGVMALYAELDDRAEDLKRVSEHKSRFLSDVSHELRTPMTSVLNLTRLLLDRADGPLSDEQQRQVEMIRDSVQTVTELVNDLLDIARIEAGQSTLRFRACTVGALLAALRGICRPLLTSNAVSLVFDDEEPNTLLETDDARVAQILRNLLSNAIKFTERGEIRVSTHVEIGDMVRFDVQDTGIGIAAGDQERIFDEFTQIDSHLQRRVHGSGLGLRLSRNLAALLGGRIELVSAPGRGSMFSLIIPRRHPGWTTGTPPNREAPNEVTVS